MDDREVLGHIMELQQGMSALNEQVKAAFKRIDEQKKLTETVHELALSLRDLTNAQKQSTSAISALQRDVDELKGKPGKRTEAIIAQVITLIVASIMGGILSKLI